jgi:hypothetical protein
MHHAGGAAPPHQPSRVKLQRAVLTTSSTNRRTRGTGADRVGDLVGEREGEPAAAAGEGERGVGAVGDQARAERDADLAPVAVKRPLASRRQRGEGDQPVALEVVNIALETEVDFPVVHARRAA